MYPDPMTAEDVVAALLRLVGAGRVDETRALLLQAPALVNAVGPHPFWGGRPQPLHVAIDTGRREMFDLLLDAGADVNGANEQYDHWSPLMLAVKRPEMRDELLRRGAHVGLPEALLLADDHRVEQLLEAGHLPSPVPNGGSILAFARTSYAIDRLIALGAPTDVRDRWGTTPLDAMGRLGAKGRALVAHMIARGVPASAKDYARIGDIDALHQIAAADPEIARQPPVLMAAVDAWQREVVEWLLRRGASANTRAADQSRQTALHSAAWNGDLEMVQLLVANGADPSARDEEHDNTPQGWAETSLRITNNPRCADVAAFLASRTGPG